MVGVILGVDFGTSNTVAVLGGPGRSPTRILFDGSLRLPSGVYAGDRDTLLTGRDAVQASYTHPERYVAHPKSVMSNEFVELGPYEYSPVDLVAAVFERVWAEATRTAQSLPRPQEIVETVITYPDNWGPGRIASLKTAANRVGMAKPRLIKEPIAAAAMLDTASYASMREDRAVIVYDLGAGTFDASVVKRKRSGFEVLQSTGLPGVAGLALDRAIAERLATQVARTDPEAAERVEHPTTNSDRREAQLFMDKVRDARESLTTQTTVQIYFPHYESELTLSRERFEELAEPILLKTVERTRDLVSDAGLAISDVDRIFLVGGASRTPLVSMLLRNEFKRPTFIMPDPEQAVAEGSIGGLQAKSHDKPPPPAAILPPAHPVPKPEPTGGRSRKLQFFGAIGVVAVLAAGISAFIVWKPWTGGKVTPQHPATTNASKPLAGDGVLRIAALLPQTGTVAEVSEGLYTGYELAIADINDAGGVLGKPVVPLRSDSGDDGTVANAAVDALLAKDADVFIGTTSSALTLQVIDKITGKGKIEISPANTALRLTNYQDGGLYFRTAPPDTFQGSVLADLVVRDQKRAVGIFVRSDEYGKGLAAVVQVALEKANVQVIRAEYQTNEKDFSQEVAQVKAAKPDAIIMIGFDETKLIIPELVKAGITAKNTNWYLVDGNFADYSTSFPPGTMEGAKATQPGAQVSDVLKARLLTLKPELKNFAYAPEAYDATVLAALAAAEAGSDNPAEIVKHMTSVSRDGQKCTTVRVCMGLIAAGTDIDYDGLSGPIEFDAAGDPTEASIGVYIYGPTNAHTNLRYVSKIL